LQERNACAKVLNILPRCVMLWLIVLAEHSKETAKCS